VLKEIDDKGDKQLREKLSQINSRGDGQNQEQSLVVANELIGGLSDKKMELLLKKQFFELSKNLANLHSGAVVDRLLGQEGIKQKYRELEEQLLASLTGDDLNAKLEEL